MPVKAKVKNPWPRNIVATLRRAGLVASLAIALAVPSGLVRPEDHAASKVVEAFHDTLLQAMKDADALGFKGRRKLLTPIITASFDTDYMVRQAVGNSYWRRFSEEQRNTLIHAFTRMTIATYAGRFNGYSGQHFETLTEETASRDRVIVKTRLVRGNGKDVKFDYVMHRRDGGWAILDIRLAGRFSELAVRRSEFWSILRIRGYKGLIVRINNNTAKYYRKG